MNDRRDVLTQVVHCWTLAFFHASTASTQMVFVSMEIRGAPGTCG